MSSPDPVTHNIEASQRNQERFEAYLLTLTFTLLGLAVQTATFGKFVGQDVSELVGWAALLASGLAGLSRAEWRPVLCGAQSARIAAETQRREYQRAALGGTKSVYVLDESREVPLAEPLERADATAKDVADRLTKLERLARRKYHIQRVGFVLGLVALMIARGWQPLSTIVSAIGATVSRVGG